MLLTSAMHWYVMVSQIGLRASRVGVVEWQLVGPCRIEFQLLAQCAKERKDSCMFEAAVSSPEFAHQAQHNNCRRRPSYQAWWDFVRLESRSFLCELLRKAAKFELATWKEFIELSMPSLQER